MNDACSRQTVRFTLTFLPQFLFQQRFCQKLCVNSVFLANDSSFLTLRSPDTCGLRWRTGVYSLRFESLGSCRGGQVQLSLWGQKQRKCVWMTARHRPSSSGASAELTCVIIIQIQHHHSEQSHWNTQHIITHTSGGTGWQKLHNTGQNTQLNRNNYTSVLNRARKTETQDITLVVKVQLLDSYCALLWSLETIQYFFKVLPLEYEYNYNFANI